MGLSPGDRIARYEIESVLGRGGMGEVYAARDTRLGRRVALKLVLAGADATARARLLREARMAATFEHPGAVVVHDVGEARVGPYIAMELVRGETLRIAAPEAPFAKRVRSIVDTARVLAAAHEAGIVHRDVKPDNVMVREDGAIKVLDFGIARFQPGVDPMAPTTPEDAASRITAEGAVVGTPLYFAPELITDGVCDARSDQFALGVVAYELIAGALPWKAESVVRIIGEILIRDPDPLPGVPEGVARAVAKMLAKKPDERFTTLTDAANALEPFAEGAPAGALPPPTRRTQEKKRRREVRYVAAAVAIAAASALGAVLWRSSRVRESAPTGAAADARPTPRPAVTALRCGPARVQARARAPRLEQVIGVGACARLAIELGVLWTAASAAADVTAPELAGATTVEVTADLDGEQPSITLTAAGRTIEARASSPLVAADEAARRLAAELAGATMDDQAVRDWGARDAASAAAMKRLWRRFDSRLWSEADERELRRLAAGDPNAPWPIAIRALTLAEVTQSGQTAGFDAALKAADRLPPPRAHALAARLHFGRWDFLGKRDDVLEGTRLARAAYAEAPDDPLAATALARIGCQAATDEARAILERAYARQGSELVPLLDWLMQCAEQADVWRPIEARLTTILPERTTAFVASYVRMGEDRAARDEAELARLLRDRSEDGKHAPGDPVTSLLLLDPVMARRQAEFGLADPRPGHAAEAAVLMTAADLMAGRVQRAVTELIGRYQRARDAGDDSAAVGAVRLELGTRRRLGQPIPDVDRIHWAEQYVAAHIEGDPLAAFLVDFELAACRVGPHTAKREAEATLDRLDRLIDRIAEGDLEQRANFRCMVIPVARAARGDADAVKRWREAVASRSAFFGSMIDAGLALEAVGDLGEAEKAYRITMDPNNIQGRAFPVMIARVRLAGVLRKQGRNEEASAIEAVVDRVWADADPGLREAVRAAK